MLEGPGGLVHGCLGSNAVVVVEPQPENRGAVLDFGGTGSGQGSSPCGEIGRAGYYVWMAAADAGVWLFGPCVRVLGVFPGCS